MKIPKIVSINNVMLNNPSPSQAKYAPTTKTGSKDADVNGILVIAKPFINFVENLIGTLIVYGIYMTINNKDPFNVYLVDEYVNSWNELYKMCKSS